MVPRPSASAARAPALGDGADFNPNVVFVAVYSDDLANPGLPQIYFKRTDQTVAAPALSGLTPVRTSCERLLTPKADVSFTLLTECATPGGGATEHIDRYLIYYGSEASEGASATGPFVNRAAVANTALTSPWTHSVTGLKPGEKYDFALLAEDEARNLNPIKFDPRANANAGLATTQKAAATMPACTPALASPSCKVIGESCRGASDGVFGPGDTVQVTVTLSNTGDFAATNLTGTIAVTRATLTLPVGGVLNVPGPIAPLTSVDVAVEFVLPAACPLAPLLTLTALASDGGLVTYADGGCTPALSPVDCLKTCASPVCQLSSLSPLAALKGVKAGLTRRDAQFEWGPDIAAQTYHLNKVIVKRDVPAPFSKRPDVLNGRGTPKCDVSSPVCIVASAVDDPDPTVFYQTYSACGLLGADEGPFF